MGSFVTDDTGKYFIFVTDNTGKCFILKYEHKEACTAVPPYIPIPSPALFPLSIYPSVYPSIYLPFHLYDPTTIIPSFCVRWCCTCSRRRLATCLTFEIPTPNSTTPTLQLQLYNSNFTTPTLELLLYNSSSNSLQVQL